MDRDIITLKKRGVVYKCTMLKCDEDYIGESATTFEGRFKEYLKAPSLIYDHFNTTGNYSNVDNFGIVGMEAQNLNRTIKEPIFIRVK